MKESVFLNRNDYLLKHIDKRLVISIESGYIGLKEMIGVCAPPAYDIACLERKGVEEKTCRASIAIEEWMQSLHLPHIISKLIHEIINILDTSQILRLAEISEKPLSRRLDELGLAIFPVLF